MTKKLEVAIAAGGTAGHINPALALAEELTRRGHHVRFIGQTDKLEGTLVPQAGFDFEPIHVMGFDRSRPWTLIQALAQIAKARGVLRRRFAELGMPDVAVGFGAYVELPLLDLCASRKVPVVIHEQNSVPGLANKVSAGKATSVCLAFPQATPAFKDRIRKGAELVVTGNPVRTSVVSASREAGRAAAGVADDETLLLVFGGSLGARHVNEGVCALKDELLARKGLRIVHSTGKGEYDSVVEALALTPEEAARWQVKPYIDNMGEMLAAADLVLSRAGASSIAEIAALAAPAMLVPYPFATADHQTTNAHYLVDAGAAVMVSDDAIGTAEFSDTLLGLVDDPARREAMRSAARGLAQDQAASALADQVEKAASIR